MLYFIRHNDGFSVVEKPPHMGVIYPFISISADQKVKLIDQRDPCDSYKLVVSQCYNPSLLKSNLQKAIRRRNIQEALITAKQLLLQEPDTLLRRLSIIMCEDCLLHPSLFQEIVWLMAALSKGYKFRLDDCQNVIRFVGACLISNGRYNLMVDDLPIDENPFDPLQFSFMLRISYGGMKGDLEFMKRLQNRVANNTLPLHSEIIYADFLSICAFDHTKHIIREAVDFHVFPSMCMLTKVPKEAIWHNRSSYNVRNYVGLEGEAAAALDDKMRAMWPLSADENTRIEEFTDSILSGISPFAQQPIEKQLRLTEFVIRSYNKKN
jgi:hypothetical protein